MEEKNGNKDFGLRARKSKKKDFGLKDINGISWEKKMETKISDCVQEKARKKIADLTAKTNKGISD